MTFVISNGGRVGLWAITRGIQRVIDLSLSAAKFNPIGNGAGIVSKVVYFDSSMEIIKSVQLRDGIASDRSGQQKQQWRGLTTILTRAFSGVRVYALKCSIESGVENPLKFRHQSGFIKWLLIFIANRNKGPFKLANKFSVEFIVEKQEH